MEAVWLLFLYLLTAWCTTGIWSSDVQQRRILLRNDRLKEMMVHLEANKVKAGLNKFLHHQLDGTKMAIKDKMAGAETAMVAHNETVDDDDPNALKPVVAPNVTASDVVVAAHNVVAPHVAVVAAHNVGAPSVAVLGHNLAAHSVVVAAHGHNVLKPGVAHAVIVLQPVAHETAAANNETALDEAAAKAPNMTAHSVLEARGHNVLKPVAAHNKTAADVVVAVNNVAAHHVAVGASNVVAPNVVVSANNVVAHNLVAHAHNIRTPATASDEVAAAAPNMTAHSVLEARGHNVRKPVAAHNKTADAHNKTAADVVVAVGNVAAHHVAVGASNVVAPNVVVSANNVSAHILVAHAHNIRTPATASDEAAAKAPNMTAHSVLEVRGHNVLKPVAAHNKTADAHNKTAADVVVAVGNVAAHHVAVGASNVVAPNVVVSANNVSAHNLVAHVHNIRTPVAAADTAAVAPNATTAPIMKREIVVGLQSRWSPMKRAIQTSK